MEELHVLRLHQAMLLGLAAHLLESGLMASSKTDSRPCSCCRPASWKRRWEASSRKGRRGLACSCSPTCSWARQMQVWWCPVSSCSLSTCTQGL